MSAAAGFEGLDASTTSTEQQQADALRFARTSVDHLREQAALAAGQLAALKTREKEIVAQHKAKTAEAKKMADTAAEELAAAEARLAELEG